MMTTFSLYELNEFIRRVLALNFNESVWITAEIAQIGVSRAHRYITLIEKEGDEIIAQSDAVLWAGDYKRIKRTLKELTDTLLQEGMEICVKARVEFHERYGLKLVIEEIDPAHTMGKLALQRIKIIQDLQKQGLIGKNATVPMPLVLQKIAVISSDKAAGMKDFAEHLLQNPYGYAFEVHLFQCAMQGLLVEKELLLQLERIESLQIKPFDCVVIIRGGGAKLDLSAFDTLFIGQAIALYPIPVLIGIGHEIDQTVPDLVAFASLKTPTAVADFIIEHNRQYEYTIIQLQQFIKDLTSQATHHASSFLIYAQEMMSLRSKAKTHTADMQLQSIQNQIQQFSQFLLKTAQGDILNKQQSIQILSVEATLHRGFSITRKKGMPLNASVKVSPGDLIETQLANGSLFSEVNRVI